MVLGKAGEQAQPGLKAQVNQRATPGEVSTFKGVCQQVGETTTDPWLPRLMGHPSCPVWSRAMTSVHSSRLSDCHAPDSRQGAAF